MGEVYEKGQIVIPKHIRDRFNIRHGSKVSFRVENNKIILEPTADWLEEFEALTSMGKYTDKEVEKKMKEAEDSMHNEWLNVP